MVVSRAASAMPSIRAMVTMIFVFLVIEVFAYPMLNMWGKTIRLTKHSTRSNLFQENALLETGNREVAIFPCFSFCNGSSRIGRGYMVSMIPEQVDRKYPGVECNSSKNSSVLLSACFFGFSSACLRNNRLGGRSHYGQPIT